MFVTDVADKVSRILSRPDFRGLAAGASAHVDPDLPTAFLVTSSGEILLSPACAADRFSVSVALRHALELLLLRRLWPQRPALVGLAAARTAALFAILERCEATAATPAPGLVAPDEAALSAEAPAGPAQAQALWAWLRRRQPGLEAAPASTTFGLLSRVWPLLGPAEWLMRAVGDPRWRIDPATGLNGDGCGLGVRSSMVSFASATGSCLSERGYAGAEAMRQRLLADWLRGDAAGRALATVRGAIRTAWELPPGTFVALASSPAEAELFALAAAQGHPDDRPVTMILAAPAEIDAAVAIAASGRHPAATTPRGVAVPPLAAIDGYRGDTEVRSIGLRDGLGGACDAAEVAAACAAMADAAVAAGRRAVLHRLDTSRTGLLGPDTCALVAIQQRHPGQVDVVVDASEARLSPDRVWEYLALGWIVILSGCGFLAGPPPSAAVLVPEGLRDRFGRRLPLGLRSYVGRAEWPPGLAAAATLPPRGDAGLALRWAAALAEMRAFSVLSPGEQQRIVGAFSGSLRAAVAGNVDLLLIDAPPPRRAACRPMPDELAWNGAACREGRWDEVGTVISFAVRDPDRAGWLSAGGARQVQAWLQADLGAFLPAEATLAQKALAGRAFEVSRPVAVQVEGREVGVLSLAASTRLVAEPPHAASTADERLARSILDAGAALDKTSLILRHWPSLNHGAATAASISSGSRRRGSPR